MSRNELTGWIIRVAGSGGERLFMVAEPTQVKAIQIAKEKIEIRDGEDLTLGMSVSGAELQGAGMRPGDVQEYG
jgi:hypothetical protein